MGDVERRHQAESEDVARGDPGDRQHSQRAEGRRDDGIADIRDGFSIESLTTDPDEIRECQAIAAVIKSTMTEKGLFATIDPMLFSHPAMLERIYSLLPYELTHQSKLNLPTRYIVESLAGVRVLRLRRLDGDKTRIAYCHLGPNLVNPFRFTLVQESTEWKVADYEAVDHGLAFSEVVAMNYLDITIAPQFGLHIDDRFREAILAQPLSASRQAFERVRLDVIPKLPQPLRDYYRCEGSSFVNQLKDNKKSQFTWLDQIESNQRFGLAHKFYSRDGLSDWPVVSSEEVIRHSEAYMTLFGSACPDVMISHAVALSRLGRVEESLPFWRQVFTITADSELGIASLGPLCQKLELKPALDPLLDEFKLRGQVEPWSRAIKLPWLPPFTLPPLKDKKEPLPDKSR